MNSWYLRPRPVRELRRSFLVLLISSMNSWYLRPRPVRELRRSSPIVSAGGGRLVAVVEVAVAKVASVTGWLLATPILSPDRLLTLRFTGSDATGCGAGG